MNTRAEPARQIHCGISAVSKMIKQVKPVLSFLQAKQHREMYNCIEITVGGGNRR